MYLLVSLGGLKGAALCLGTDGHVGMKSFPKGQCIPTTPTNLYPKSPLCTTDTLLVQDECGPCTDIPLAVHDSPQVPWRLDDKSLTKAKAGNPIPALQVIRTCEFTPTKNSISPSLPLSGNFDLDSLRCVVLLI